MRNQAKYVLRWIFFNELFLCWNKAWERENEISILDKMNEKLMFHMQDLFDKILILLVFYKNSIIKLLS